MIVASGARPTKPVPPVGRAAMMPATLVPWPTVSVVPLALPRTGVLPVSFFFELLGQQVRAAALASTASLSCGFFDVDAGVDDRDPDALARGVLPQFVEQRPAGATRGALRRLLRREARTASGVSRRSRGGGEHQVPAGGDDSGGGNRCPATQACRAVGASRSVALYVISRLPLRSPAAAARQRWTAAARWAGMRPGGRDRAPA